MPVVVQAQIHLWLMPDDKMTRILELSSAFINHATVTLIFDDNTRVDYVASGRVLVDMLVTDSRFSQSVRRFDNASTHTFSVRSNHHRKTLQDVEQHDIANLFTGHHYHPLTHNCQHS